MVLKIELKRLLSTVFFLAMVLNFGLDAKKSKANGTVGESVVPDVTVVCVVDQFAYHYLDKLKEHFTGGLKRLLEQGLNYEYACHPHGLPCTATGHAGIATGCCAKNHGIVDNEMPDVHTGIVRPADEGADKITSSKRLMTDNLVDQFMLRQSLGKRHHAFSLSLKSRAAVMMGGKQGKVIWFDSERGEFDSSVAYYDRLPDWLCKFNAKNRVSSSKQCVWQTRFKPHSAAYDFAEIDNYEYAAIAPLINRPFFIDHEAKAPYELFLKTPHAQKKLLDLARCCIDVHYVDKNKDRVLLYMSLSSLDMVGHMYGPDSRECIDMLYHLDAQLEEFLNYLFKKVPKHKALFVITGDHGIMPIPEVLHKKGQTSAQRILAKNLIAQMNTALEQEYEVKGIVSSYQPPYFLMDHKQFKRFAPKAQHEILLFLKEFLKKQTGIRDAWLTQELVQGSFNRSSLEYNFQQQIYPGRTGELLCLTHPYVMLTNYDKGTSHATPYTYDTQVPLILLQPGVLLADSVYSLVAMQQLPVSLAKLLRVQTPSASMFKPLPGLFKE